MKKFDKFILWLFSLIMILQIVFIVLLVFDFFSARELLETIPKEFYVLIATDKDIIITSTVILLVLFMLSLKGFLFQSKLKKDKIDGILLENNNGKLLISRETLENLVKDISKRIKGTESISSKIHLDENNEIVVNISAVVYQDAIIKEVTKRMQEDIKFAIKQASDLEVSEVNVTIDKISNKVSPEMKQKEMKDIKVETEPDIKLLEDQVEKVDKEKIEVSKDIKKSKELKEITEIKEEKEEKEKVNKKKDKKKVKDSKKESKDTKVSKELKDK